MSRTRRTLDLMLYLQRWPRTFAEIQERYLDTSERTLWRMLGDVRSVAGLDLDHRGRYSVPVRTFAPLPEAPRSGDLLVAEG